MTALALLGYIAAAGIAQVIAAIIIAVLRRKPVAAPATAGSTIALRAATSAWVGPRSFRVRARELEDQSGTQASFYLEPIDALPLAPYTAGQFLTFQLALPDLQGTLETVTRCYSLSDCHSPAAYRITVKRVPAPVDRPELPGGLVSNHFHDRVQPGTVLQVRAPAGFFVLDDDPGVPAVLIAGGIGITPLFAMARAGLEAQPDRAIHLFYGVHDRRELVFEAALTAMRNNHSNFRITVVESSPLPGEETTDLPHEVGFIDVALLRRLLPHGDHHFYICGPPPMMAALVPALRDWGVATDAVRYEAFGPASFESAEAVAAIPLATPLQVQFTRAGRTLDWTGADTNLLDFAERHGIEVASGCRSGSCGTCETKVIAGAVRYARPPSYDVAPGQCLLCIGVPDGDLELDA